MNIAVFLDDEREPGSWLLKSFDKVIIIRSYHEFVKYINDRGCPDFITFDHDLGEQKTGYDAACYLINKDLDNKGFVPDHFWYSVHSQNPVGAANISNLMFNYFQK